MQTPWIQQLFYRMSAWLSRRAGPSAVAARGRVHILVGVPSLQPLYDIVTGLPECNGNNWPNSGHARAAAAANELLLTVTPLAEIRQEFIMALRDIPSATARDLRQRIHVCRSLRGLWHLRAELFNEVAMQHSEHEAQSRFAQLNRHIPRPARSLIHQAHRHNQPRPWRAK